MVEIKMKVIDLDPVTNDRQPGWTRWKFGGFPCGHVQQHSKDDKQNGDDHGQTILKSARLLEQYL